VRSISKRSPERHEHRFTDRGDGDVAAGDVHRRLQLEELSLRSVELRAGGILEHEHAAQRQSLAVDFEGGPTVACLDPEVLADREHSLAHHVTGHVLTPRSR
jgi:hypothetical protein